MYIYVSQGGMNVLEMVYTLITDTCTGALSESDTRNSSVDKKMGLKCNSCLCFKQMKVDLLDLVL